VECNVLASIKFFLPIPKMSLFTVLSVCPHNKPAIIECGGMEALARHLRSDHSKITYHCSWTMRNLSDVTTNIENPGEIFNHLVHRMGAIRNDIQNEGHLS